jgi:pilus assembly protein Flp/PilA
MAGNSMMFKKLGRFLQREDDGATAVEYAVMLALIFLVCLGAIVTLGQNTKTSWQNSSNSITTAVSGS